ncbi:MAG TPA: TIGR03936 family radical SAM-associated protein [Symbiobacteriaceae bacterium]|nr:TIGR03936 family radical SAM-associated protein [Symbiobacteriaceae bacterium]
MKVRVRMAKTDLSRFLSHLDLQRTLERTLRRAGLPLAFTQGYNPHPRISFASALATGTSSEGEFVDIDLTEELPPAELVARVNAQSPVGLRFLEARVVPDKGDSLFSLIDVAEYRLTVSVPAAVPEGALPAAVAAFLARDVVAVEKEGKRGARVLNIREQVYGLTVEGALPEPDGTGLVVNLRALLQSGSQGSLKPETLLEGLQAVAPELGAAALVGAHRLMLYRRDAESGVLLEPWDL